jgi:hypothetical protein
MEFQHGVSKEKYMHKSILVISLFCLTFIAGSASEIKSGDTVVKKYSSNQSSNLEAQILKSDLELKVAQAKLAKLTITNKISKISLPNNVLNNTDVSFLAITSFDGKAMAEIQINGNKHRYKQGDLISDVVLIQKITNNSIVIENTNTHKTKKFFVGNGN